MLENYLGKYNIQNVQIQNIRTEFQELKSSITQEYLKPEIIKPHFIMRLFYTVFFIVSTIIFFAMIIDIFQYNWDFTKSKNLIGALVISGFQALATYLMFKKKILIKEIAPSTIELKAKKDFPDYFFKNNKDGIRLGKIEDIRKNDITGNLKKLFIGEVYISFSKNNSDLNSISIINTDDQVLAIKKFNVNEIVTCKKHTLDYDDSKYQVDTADLEFAMRNANDARLERSMSRGLGRSEGYLGSISNDMKLIREREAKDELEKKVKDMDKKIKDETEILDLQFEDGSSFLISHINNTALHQLHKIIENN